MASQNDLVQGMDLAGQTQVSGADLEQLVREATPADNIAWIIVDATTPDVASNTRFARYLWQSAAGAWPKYYTGATWSNLPVPSDAVSAEQIAAGSITLDKLSPDGTALQVVRMNAGGTALEFADFTLGAQTVNVTSLIKGTANQLLITNAAGTSQEWLTGADWFTRVGQVVDASNLLQGLANTNEVLTWDGSSWSPISVAAGLTDASVTLAKLSVTGTYKQVVRVKSGGVGVEVGNVDAAVVTPGTANQVMQTSNDGTTVSFRTLFTVSPATVMTAGTTTYAAGLTFTPKIMRCYASPTSVKNGYASTDQVDISMFSAGHDASNDVPCGFYYDTAAGSFSAIFQSTTGVPMIVNKSTRNYEAVDTISSWNVYFVYSNF